MGTDSTLDHHTIHVLEDIAILQRSKMAARIMLVLVLLALLAPVTEAFICQFVQVWNDVFNCGQDGENSNILCQIGTLLGTTFGCFTPDK